MAAEEVRGVVAVVGDDDAAMRGVGVLEVRAAAFAHGEFLFEVGEHAHLEGVDVDLGELALHADHVDLVGGVGQVTAGGGDADVHERGDRADVAVDVDRVGPDEELVALPVDHAVGIGADDRLGMLREVHAVVDAEEAGSGAGALLVRHVGDEPEAVGPGHEAADAGLGAGGEVSGLDGQVRHDAGDVVVRDGLCLHG